MYYCFEQLFISSTWRIMVCIYSQLLRNFRKLTFVTFKVVAFWTCDDMQKEISWITSYHFLHFQGSQTLSWTKHFSGLVLQCKILLYPLNFNVRKIHHKESNFKKFKGNVILQLTTRMIIQLNKMLERKAAARSSNTSHMRTFINYNKILQIFTVHSLNLFLQLFMFSLTSSISLGYRVSPVSRRWTGRLGIPWNHRSWALRTCRGLGTSVICMPFSETPQLVKHSSRSTWQ